MRTLDAKAHAVLTLIVEQLSASGTDEMRLSSVARGLGRNHAARLFHSVLTLSQVRPNLRYVMLCSLMMMMAAATYTMHVRIGPILSVFHLMETC